MQNPPINRVFLIILDSLGIGELPDAAEYGDLGSNTLAACANSGGLIIPNLQALGIFNIEGVGCGEKSASPRGCYARMAERSRGKDTTIGHWEIAGICSPEPLPTYPEGFPPELVRAFERLAGRGTLCNRPYSGTEVIADYGEEHMRTGKLIIYTSADSVFQIAAHEDVVPLGELYRCCEAARGLLTGKHGVGRVIARPFTGKAPGFKRTANRHDYSLAPPSDTMCDILQNAGLETIGIGKIHDIFAGRGISRSIRTQGNADGMDKTLELARESFRGLAFINLVDFDTVYGHRNDVSGYASALNAFDIALGRLTDILRDDDIIIITADHGCDPATPSTDHSREYTPMLAYGKALKKGVDLGTRSTFADIAATVLDIFGAKESLSGKSFLAEVR